LAHLFSDLVSYVSGVSAHQNGQIRKRHDYNNLLNMSEHAILTKTKLKQKFFSQISDHQQSVVPAPSRGYPHTPSLLVVADLQK
jgi:hypothetical protein